MDQPKRKGRPPMGKRGTFTFRVTDRLRTMLEEAAAASHRSVSQEIEFRLEQSFSQQDMRALIIDAVQEATANNSPKSGFVSGGDKK